MHELSLVLKLASIWVTGNQFTMIAFRSYKQLFKKNIFRNYAIIKGNAPSKYVANVHIRIKITMYSTLFSLTYVSSLIENLPEAITEIYDIIQNLTSDDKIEKAQNTLIMRGNCVIIKQSSEHFNYHGSDGFGTSNIQTGKSWQNNSSTI